MRTNITVTEKDTYIPAGTAGVVTAVDRWMTFPVEVDLPGHAKPARFRSDELETIE